MPSNERTPLLAVVQVAPQQPRYPHHTLRRFCTIFLSVIPAIIIITFIVSLFLPEDAIRWPGYGHGGEHRHQHPPWPSTKGLSYEDLQKVLISTPSEEKAREWSQYYTSSPHLAGQNISQAKWTEQKWKEFGVEHTEIVSYDVYLNYPKDHRLALLKNDEVEFEARLEEDVLDEDPTTGLENRVPTFHGYSANGNVTAQFVYVNYGTQEDYADLRAAGVALEGKIALARYGGIFRGLKIKGAAEQGMIGCAIYSDPGDDGEMTEANGFDAYPDGPARHPNSVQRGSAQFLSIAPGDPTTPGYPSKPGAPRKDPQGSIPSIPSVPLSYTDALPFLRALNGHGPKAADFDSPFWHSGGLGYKGVDYNIGPSPKELTINLFNEQEYVTTPIWNVIGVINGTIEDEAVVIGNHRDAWIAGGAGDPNSGSATLNEVVRSFGEALKQDWKPLRSIVFASWDGEEYGLLGSTEWVEEFLPWLNKNALAYLNVDVAVSGTSLKVASSPVLNEAIREVTKMVQSPNQTVEGQTVYDVWNKHIAVMGSGSDFTAFLDYAGVPSADLGFQPTPNTPVYHYHSNYDSFHWMDTYGDPGFHHHIAVAKIWGLLTAKLVSQPVVEFNATEYAKELMGYVRKVQDKIHGLGLTLDDIDYESASTSPTVGDARNNGPSFSKLQDSLSRLHKAAKDLDIEASEIAEELKHNPIPWWEWYERAKRYSRLRTVNKKYIFLERYFLHEPGLESRPWYKHVVYAPGLWTGYSGKVFPGLVEALDSGDHAAAKKWVGIIDDKVRAAVKHISQ